MKTARDQFSRRREMSVREYDPAGKASLFGTGEVVPDAASPECVVGVDQRRVADNDGGSCDGWTDGP